MTSPFVESYGAATAHCSAGGQPLEHLRDE